MKEQGILTDYGYVSEHMRLQASTNMRRDKAVKQRVEEYLIGKHGPEEGMRIAKQNYKEAYSWRKVWLDFKERIGL